LNSDPSALRAPPLTRGGVVAPGKIVLRNKVHQLGKFPSLSKEGAEHPGYNINQGKIYSCNQMTIKKTSSMIKISIDALQ